MRQKLDLLSDAAEELTTILQVCCEEYDVNINEVKSRSRKRGGVMEARQMYCYVAYNKFEHKLGNIAAIVNRDHATALHSIRVVQDYLDTKYSDTMGQYKKICDCLLSLDRIILVDLARKRIERRERLNERDKRFIQQFTY
jgi:chromosomal replication initiation ATPase DnaA